MTKKTKALVVAVLLLAGAILGVVAQNMSIGETYLTHLSLLSQLSLPSTRGNVILWRDTGTVSSAASATIWYQSDPDGTGTTRGEAIIIDFDGDGTVDTDADGTGAGMADVVLSNCGTGGFAGNDHDCDGTLGE